MAPEALNAQSKSMKLSGSTWRPAVPALFFVLVSFAMLLRALSMPGPLLASDEYAYNILSRYFGLRELFSLDPGLQQIENHLYLALQHLWIRIGGGDGLLVTRAVHVMEWLAAAFVLRATFAGVASERAILLGTMAMVLLPTSFYTLTAMPETDLACMAALLGYMVIRWLPVTPLPAALAAGAISGLALLLKPHAVAWIPAVLLTIACLASSRRREGPQAAVALGAALLFLAGWYLAFLLGWRISVGSWEPNPSAALGLKFYGSHVSAAADSNFLARNALAILGYAIAHLIVLGVIFGPALAALGKPLRAIAFAAPTPARPLIAATTFVLAMLLGHLAMVTYFSATAGDKNTFEAGRLHGRYLGSVLIFLPFLYFAFLEQVSVRSARLLAAVGLLLCVTFKLLVLQLFKVFPWDYPELFAFFSAPGSHQWSFDGQDSSGTYVLAFCMLIFAIALLRPTLFRALMTIQLLVLLCAGHVQMQRWANAHVASNRPNIENAAALGQVLQPAAPGDGLVIGADRYGKLSYILFNLGSAPRVLVKQPGETIAATDIQHAKWVIVADEYNIEFPYRSLIRFGGLTLYPLATTMPAVAVAEKKSWSGEPLKLELGTAAPFNVGLSGFNTPEIWGAWTAQPTAEIELPFTVQGTLHLRLFSWTIPGHEHNALRVMLGDAAQDLALTGVGTEYRLDLRVAEPTDRIRLSIPITRPADSARDMGAAIAWLELTR